jgi:hypothetical protein
MNKILQIQQPFTHLVGAEEKKGINRKEVSVLAHSSKSYTKSENISTKIYTS